MLFYLSESTSDLSRRTPQWELPLRAVCLPSHLFCHTPPAERARSRVIRQEIQHKFQLECEYSPSSQRHLTPQWCSDCFYSIFFPSSGAGFWHLNAFFKKKSGLAFEMQRCLWITQSTICILRCLTSLGQPFYCQGGVACFYELATINRIQMNAQLHHELWPWMFLWPRNHVLRVILSVRWSPRKTGAAPKLRIRLPCHEG